MRSITVEPEQLENSASNIENANADYQRIVASMYASVDRMSSSWQGKDNTAFTNQIKTFEDDLKQISIILSEYAAFLKNSARGYRQAQEELYSQAGRLRV